MREFRSSKLADGGTPGIWAWLPENLGEITPANRRRMRCPSPSDE